MKKLKVISHKLRTCGWWEHRPWATKINRNCRDKALPCLIFVRFFTHNWTLIRQCSALSLRFGGIFFMHNWTLIRQGSALSLRFGRSFFSHNWTLIRQGSALSLRFGRSFFTHNWTLIRQSSALSLRFGGSFFTHNWTLIRQGSALSLRFGGIFFTHNWTLIRQGSALSLRFGRSFFSHNWTLIRQGSALSLRFGRSFFTHNWTLIRQGSALSLHFGRSFFTHNWTLIRQGSALSLRLGRSFFMHNWTLIRQGSALSLRFGRSFFTHNWTLIRRGSALSLRFGGYNSQVKYASLFLLLLGILSSCSVTKHLPAGESLYVGAKVKMLPDSIIPKAEVKNIQEELIVFVKPKPNTSIFGFPYRVWLYYLLGEPKKESGLKYSFRKRFGEPPILASKSVTNANVKQIALLLNNEGYFRSTVTGELTEKNRKTTAVYTATLHQRYYLDSVIFSPNDTTAIGKVFRDAQKNSTLKKGVPYRFELISGERNRIDNILKRRGFYYFQPDYIIAKIDSSKNNHTVNLSIEIKPTTSQVARKIYYVRDVHVKSDYGEVIVVDSLKSKGTEVEFNGIKIEDKTGSYRPSIFSQAIGFRRGVRYSNAVQDISLSRLINLNNNFKFVRNTFQLVPRSDSALLDIYYYLTPLKAKSLALEVNATTKSNNFTGTNLSVSWNNKNTFGGAELLKITAKIGFDFQVSGISSTLGAINNKTYGVNALLTIPRFVLPFFKANPITNQSLPKTNIGIDYEVNNRSGLYDLTSSRITLGYAWKQNNSIEHAFTPVSVNLVKAQNFSEDFNMDVFRSDNATAILKALENTIIMSSNYVINYTPSLKRDAKHTFSFTGGVEVAGNLASLLSARDNTAGTQTLFGVTIAQYVRFDADVRYAYNINKSLKIANRFLIGYGVPYGNSSTLPFVKQYTSGGNNSIRAFPARAIGPGNYVSSGNINSQFLGTQTGDIKLELNTELRVKFNKYVNGAFFIDAGNVWLQKSDDYGQGAIFKSDFLKQVAIGTGIGLRLDFSVLVLRFDLATPVRKPFLPEDDRWVLKNFNLKDSNWRSENLILNIAVGYPF